MLHRFQVGALSFVPPLYGAQFIRQNAGRPSNVETFFELLNYLIPALLSPLVGMLVDAWGAGRVYLMAVVVGGLVALAPVLYWWAHVSEAHAVASMFLGQINARFVLSVDGRGLPLGGRALPS